MISPPDEAWRGLLQRFEQDRCSGKSLVATVAEHFSVSSRTAHRYAVAHFGFGPKRLERLLRLRRFRALMRERGGLTLTSAAYICGYCDQSHLAREARALSAMTPSQIRELERGST